MTYTVLNLVMFCIIAYGYVVVKPPVKVIALLATLIVLIVLTVIFDNLIILAHIVAYHPAQTLQVYLYKMPIEDLSYAVAACLLVPLLWGKEKRDA